MPGQRKIYVTANGDFRLCERIDDSAPIIGNVLSGINIRTIKEVYVDGYSKRSMSYCSSCWAIQLCDVCYISAFKNGQFDESKKGSICVHIRDSKEKYLRLLSKVLEIDKNGLDYLSKFILS